MTNDTTTIVGIDLGTTNSLCAVFQDGAPKLIPNAHGDVLTPSVVGILDDGRIVVGAAARELRVTKPDRCASRFKRLMGSGGTVTLGGQTLNAAELSSLVLKSLKQDAEAYLGHEVAQAVITVPAYFNDHQRKATKLAGEMAGFKVRRIINEPTAAALTYGFHDRQAEKHLLVIDLGGGTFDVTLMETFSGTLEIIATAGESFLGGEDFTDRLVSALFKQEGVNFEAAELKQPLRVARLREECEQAKRTLAEQPETTVRMPNDAGEFDERPRTAKITRQAFATLVEPLIKRLRGPIDKALRDSDRGPADLDDVILVGGATRMPALHAFVSDYLKCAPRTAFNPDEVVALGAAVQSALISNDTAVDDMVMTDVCPFTLGVEVAKDFDRQARAGYFQPIIHRNTTIPVSREEVFATMVQNQFEVKIRVFQGESRRVGDNLLLGELKVTGIPPGPAGVPVVVRFTYDLNGILEVEAFVPDSGKRFQTVLTQHAAGLSPEEINEAVKKLARLKFYPRDDVENQRLKLYCERLVGEISPYNREPMEEALDMFERAMSSGDREWFAQAKDGLLMVLSQLGYSFDPAEDLRNEQG